MWYGHHMWVYAMKKHVYILPRNTDTDWFSLVVYHFYISINYMY